MNTFSCDFCKIKLSTEALLFNHLCEQKRRHLQRDDKPVKLAFMIYQRVLTRGMRHPEPSYKSFANSNLYTAFIKFARYLIDLNAINPMSFVDFLVRIEAKLDRWTNPTFYGTYIRELNKNEKPTEAIERNLLLIEQWAMNTGEDWRDFFGKIPPAMATLWIINGRISPWLLLTAYRAPDLIRRLNAEQTMMMEQAIDSDYWSAKVIRHQPEVDRLRAMLEKDGL